MALITRTKHIYLISVKNNSSETISYAVSNFRGAYKLAIFDNGIVRANLGERHAKKVLNRLQKTIIWDKSKFSTLEEALWSPEGKIILIEKIKFRVI